MKSSRTLSNHKKFEDNKKYTDRLKSARKITKQNDAVSIAKGKVKNIDVVVGAQDFRFIGGSFGAASGEAFIAGVQHSIENNMPFIFFSLFMSLVTKLVLLTSTAISP